MGPISLFQLRAHLVMCQRCADRPEHFSRRANVALCFTKLGSNVSVEPDVVLHRKQWFPVNSSQWGLQLIHFTLASDWYSASADTQSPGIGIRTEKVKLVSLPVQTWNKVLVLLLGYKSISLDFVHITAATNDYLITWENGEKSVSKSPRGRPQTCCFLHNSKNIHFTVTEK